MVPAPIADLRLGARALSRVGLGCAAWSLTELPESIAANTFAAALDAGVSLIDTALAYTTTDETHHNERVLGQLLAGVERPPLVVTKGGHHRVTATQWGIDGRPETLARQCRGSLHALGLEQLPMYLLHRPDPDVPIAESVGALSDLQRQGLIAEIGVSNVNVTQLERARSVAPIAVVENVFSPLDRSNAALVQHCATQGISFLAYSPLGGPGALARAKDRLRATEEIAETNGISVQRTLLAWLLRRYPSVLAIVGSSRPASIRDSVAALDLTLAEDEWARIDEEVSHIDANLA